MVSSSRYPKLNDVPHERPMLAAYGNTAFGELIWLAIPLIVIALVSFLR